MSTYDLAGEIEVIALLEVAEEASGRVLSYLTNVPPNLPTLEHRMLASWRSLILLFLHSKAQLCNKF